MLDKPPQPCITHAVVVGGGPSGLATALLLRQHRLAHKITLLERIIPSDLQSSSPRSYSLRIGPSILSFIKSIDGLFDIIRPKMLDAHPFKMHSFQPDGANHLKSFGLAAQKNLQGMTFWIQRNDMANAFLQLLQRPTNDIPVSVMCAVTCTDIQFRPHGPPIRLHYEHRDGSRHSLDADFVVGADGINSKLRTLLQTHFLAGNITTAFHTEKYPSPATDLRLKSIHMPTATFYTNSTTHAKAQEIKMTQTTAYSLLGKWPWRKPYPGIRLFCFPIGPDPTLGRLASIVTTPNHPIMTADSPAHAYKILQESFPAIDIPRTFPSAPLQQFLDAKPHAFPTPQRAASLVAPIRSGAVALVGDALHAFPPDHGLGLASGLEEATLLCDCIRESGLQDGVRVYERERDDDVRAMVRMHQLDAAYQYRQSRLGYAYSLFNQRLRVKLSKFAPRIFHPNMRDLLRKGCSYVEAEKLIKLTTVRIYGIVSVFLATVAAAFAYLLVV